MTEPLWTPDPARAAASAMQDFLERARRESGEPLPDYAALYDWSVHDREAFWGLLAAYLDLPFAGSEPVLARDSMPGAEWFPAATLNAAEILLSRRDDTPALVFRDERGRRRVLSYAELGDEVRRVAAGLHALGVGPGDRVAGYLPNCPEAVIAMLASASLGAVWSSCSPDFGRQGVLDRFGQIRPKVLFATDGYCYAGKRIDLRERVAELAAALPSVEHQVPVAFLEDPDPRDEFAQFGRGLPFPGFLQLPFSHPLYVLYSSGTTGIPKCIVHGAGGTLLQHMKEHRLHVDLRSDDVLFYFTTTGWMMWNWLVSGLATGATLVLYDGSPVHPDSGVLWRVAEEEGITVFGTSPRYLSGLEQAGYRPAELHDLSGLRTVLSTGSPLAPEQFQYVYAAIAEDVHLASIAGGTDLISCFVLGNPLLPVYAGEIQCRGLGMAVEVFASDGGTVQEQAGELVCTKAFPSMPVGFFDDPGGRRYHAAYFEKFPGVWAHGDHAVLTRSGGMLMEGRSDAVLNPGGVRIGTAEIYRVLATVPGVMEGVAVAQRAQGDERVVLGVVLAPGVTLDEKLQDRIRQALRQQASPRHVPAVIFAVTDIPRTLSGKTAELAVRATIHGESVGNQAALANPESLQEFVDRPELAS